MHRINVNIMHGVLQAQITWILLVHATWGGVGYQGHLCELDVDECAVSVPCRNGATCKNTNGSYQCLCARGYEGKDCNINTDDCAIICHQQFGES